MIDYYKDGHVTGFSRSGLATSIRYDDLLFDLGECIEDFVKIDTVFLSHTHLDHSGGVLRYLQMRGLYGLPTPTIYAPYASVEALRQLVDAMSTLDRATVQMPNIVGLQHGMEITYKNYRIEIFAVDHVVPSIGFRVLCPTQKLKVEFRGRTDIEVLRKTTEVYDLIEKPVCTYIGDSTIETLKNNPALLDTSVLFLECTYFDSERAMAATHGHTCWTDLREFLDEHHDRLPKKIYLKHFSLRYKPEQIKKEIAHYPNTIVML